MSNIMTSSNILTRIKENEEMNKVHEFLNEEQNRLFYILGVVTSMVDCDHDNSVPKALRDAVVSYWEHKNKGIQ